MYSIAFEAAIHIFDGVKGSVYLPELIFKTTNGALYDFFVARPQSDGY